MCIYYPPSYDWKMMGSRRFWYSSTWALFPLKTPATQKCLILNMPLNHTITKKTVTELTWCSARMFNCNEFNPVILINFYGIQFLKTSWQQIRQWKKTMLQAVEFICWNCIFSITSFQFPEVSHNFCMYFPKVLQSLTKSPKCNFPIKLHVSRLQTTESVTTAGVDWTRLTVNHHVDEKYGKLALDSIKKLGKRKWDEGKLLFSHLQQGGSGWLNFNWKWNSAEEIYGKVDIGNEKWETHSEE